MLQYQGTFVHVPAQTSLTNGSGIQAMWYWHGLIQKSVSFETIVNLSNQQACPPVSVCHHPSRLLDKSSGKRFMRTLLCVGIIKLLNLDGITPPVNHPVACCPDLLGGLPRWANILVDGRLHGCELFRQCRVCHRRTHPRGVGARPTGVEVVADTAWDPRPGRVRAGHVLHVCSVPEPHARVPCRICRSDCRATGACCLVIHLLFSNKNNKSKNLF